MGGKSKKQIIKNYGPIQQVNVNENKTEFNIGNTIEKSVSDEKQETKRWLIGLIVSSIISLICAFIAAGVIFPPTDVTNNPGTEQKENTIQLYENTEEIYASHKEYVKCIITSVPVLPGYQVKPYPYLCLMEEEGWRYYPIAGLYTQEQYSADENGVCTLIRENISDQIQFLLKNEMDLEQGIDYDLGCLLIIEHVSNNEKESRKALELRIGQLTVPDDERIVKILKASQEGTVILDVTAWPANKDKIIELIVKE